METPSLGASGRRFLSRASSVSTRDHRGGAAAALAPAPSVQRTPACAPEAMASGHQQAQSRLAPCWGQGEDSGCRACCADRSGLSCPTTAPVRTRLGRCWPCPGPRTDAHSSTAAPLLASAPLACRNPVTAQPSRRSRPGQGSVAHPSWVQGAQAGLQHRDPRPPLQRQPLGEERGENTGLFEAWKLQQGSRAGWGGAGALHWGPSLGSLDTARHTSATPGTCAPQCVQGTRS